MTISDNVKINLLRAFTVASTLFTANTVFGLFTRSVPSLGSAAFCAASPVISLVANMWAQDLRGDQRADTLAARASHMSAAGAGLFGLRCLMQPKETFVEGCASAAGIAVGILSAIQNAANVGVRKTIEAPADAKEAAEDAKEAVEDAKEAAENGKRAAKRGKDAAAQIASKAWNRNKEEPPTADEVRQFLQAAKQISQAFKEVVQAHSAACQAHSAAYQAHKKAIQACRIANYDNETDQARKEAYQAIEEISIARQEAYQAFNDMCLVLDLLEAIKENVQAPPSVK